MLTCVRRNFKSYPLIMNKIVSTASAICLFDMIKNVMSSTVPGKKDPKAKQSRQSQGHCDLPKGAEQPGSLPPPPYSLDLALCDVWLFSLNREKLTGR